MTGPEKGIPPTQKLPLFQQYLNGHLYEENRNYSHLPWQEVPYLFKTTSFNKFKKGMRNK